MPPGSRQGRKPRRCSAVRLTVLGSADAFCGAGRGNAAYLIEDPAGCVAVDFGPTALLALTGLGIDPDSLDGVMLTHLHGDHFGGVHLLFIDALDRARRRRPLVIAGPPGTRRTVRDWLALAWSRSGRRPPPFPMRYVEYRPGDVRELLGRRVRVFAAQHQSPPAIAVGLRIETAGRVLAFTGDTGWSPELPRLCEGAALVVCECTAVQPTRGHLCWPELRRHLPELGARQIVISHLSPESRRAVRSGQRRVRVAEDGMRLVVR